MIHLTVLVLLYFLPTIIASNRGHSVAGILLLNLFLGLDRHRLDRHAALGAALHPALLPLSSVLPPLLLALGSPPGPQPICKLPATGRFYTFGEKSVSFINVTSCSFTNAPSFSVSAFSAIHSGSAENFAQLSVAAARLLCRSK